MNWYVKAMKEYFNFSGRATRSEFWYFLLFYIILLFSPLVVASYFRLDKEIADTFTIIVFLIHLIPATAVGVRRLHDMNISGWWYLITLLPYIGVFIFLFMAAGKSKEENKFIYGSRKK